MESLLVYSLLTSSLYYLGSRATITTFLWSKYPPALARFMDCAACAGTWFGFGLGLVLLLGRKLSLPGLPGDAWYSPFLVGLCSMVWTPIIAGLMQQGFEQLGSAVPARRKSRGRR
jgi:hypothetical protein